MSGIPKSQCMSMFTLERTVLHGLAKFCWGDFILKRDIKNYVYSFLMLEKLIAYRDDVINKVPKSLNRLPKSSCLIFNPEIINAVTNAVYNLFEGYYEAVCWEMKFADSLPFTILNPFTSGIYQAGNFIDANRHFNDFEWAKKFVADEDQLIKTRFLFACIYCFEEDIINIWNIVKIKEQLPWNAIFKYNKRYDSFIALWTHNLKDTFYVPGAGDYICFKNGFFLAGLKKAFSLQYEYAMQYFWNNCSEKEKTQGMCDIDDSDIWYVSSSPGMSNFIYSILPLNEKIHKICCVYERKEPFMLWSNLLHSRFFETALDDIYDFSSCVPLEIYGRLLILLAEEIIEKQLPIHKSIFRDLWNDFSKEQQKSMLKKEKYIINRLIGHRYTRMITEAGDFVRFIDNILSEEEEEKTILAENISI